MFYFCVCIITVSYKGQSDGTLKSSIVSCISISVGIQQEECVCVCCSERSLYTRVHLEL
jgi:hypothetical protein